jgi:hypothetical protein
MILTEQQHLVNALSPVADALSGTVYSDIINMKNFGHCTFVVQKGVGATGTSTFTVEASDDTSGTNVTAIPFRYREIPLSTNVPTALTDATASGFTNTAGSDRLVIIEVDASELGDTGYGFVRLKAVESVDSPVLAGILAILSQPRYAQSVFATAIS